MLARRQEETGIIRGKETFPRVSKRKEKRRRPLLKVQWSSGIRHTRPVANRNNAVTNQPPGIRKWGYSRSPGGREQVTRHEEKKKKNRREPTATARVRGERRESNW